MDLHPYADPKGWLRSSALAPHIEAFLEHLKQGRYAVSTTNHYVACIAHFARWMTESYLAVDRIDEVSIGQFLRHHLPHCRCSAPVVRTHRDVQAACGHLLRMLRHRGVIADPVAVPSPSTKSYAASTNICAASVASGRRHAVDAFASCSACCWSGLPADRSCLRRCGRTTCAISSPASSSSAARLPTPARWPRPFAATCASARLAGIAFMHSRAPSLRRRSGARQRFPGL